MNRFLTEPRYWLLLPLLWGALALLSLAWNFHAVDRYAEELAANKARFVFSVVDSVRLWNSRSGGVYVPAQFAEGDHLASAHGREIVTTEGERLHLVIPAHMTRQLAETLAQVSPIQVRFTSLAPINPANGADAWESEALRGFSRGDAERFAVSTRAATPTARFVGPIRTQAACLKCHVHATDPVGGVRGGLSVSFPVTELLASAGAQKRNLAVVHAAAWMLLSALTLLALLRIRADLRSLHQAKEQQYALVEQRTAQLREQVQERERAEARLRLLIESSGDGIYGVDADGRITFINSAGLRLLGYDSPEQVLGGEPALWHPLPAAESGAAESHLSQTLRDGVHVHREDQTFRRSDGTVFPVEYRAQPLVHDGRITGAVVSFDDITERKRKEHELRKLSNAVEHSPESVVITDVNGVIEYVNRKFVETTGFPAQEVIGRKPSLLKSGQTRPEVYQELWDTITAGHVWQGAILNRKRSGELFWEEESISPITDEQGRITHFVGVKEDITERRRLEEKIWRQANFDSLTELPNRRLFYDRLQQALARAQRDGRPLALMFIDLDRFKEVNDTHGHTAGDELLREAARRLLRSVRRSDTVARMGGDEFTVILSSFDDDGETVTVIAERARAALAQRFEIEPCPVTISASIGVVYFPDDGDSMETLLKNADIAMYRAKEKGRDAVVFFGGRIPQR